MNKKFFYSAVFALFFAGAAQMNAQQIQVEPLKPEVQQMADQIIATQMENPDEANKVFTKMLRKIQKDKDQLASAAKFFLDNKVYPCAKQCSEKAYELDGQNVNVLMLNAEVAMMRKDYGTAGQRYDEIIAQNPDNIPALKRRAFIYKNINPAIAIQDLQKIKQVEPNNIEADKELGDISYAEGNYADAVKFYKTYYAGTPKTKEALDLRSAENYIQSLYSQTDYETALSIINEVQPLDPEDLVFHRMKFFSSFEKYNLDPTDDKLPALAETANYISSNKYDSLYIYLDYLYMANLLDQQQQFADAAKYMRLGVEKDPSKLAGLKTLSDLLVKNKETDEGLKVYGEYLDKLGDAAKNADYFRLARMYGAAAKESEGAKRADYLAKADAALDKVEALNAGNYTITYQRARIHNLEAKPSADVKALYEEMIRRSEGDEGAADARVEAFNYLMVYGIQTEDLASARTACDQLLKLDPEHEMGKKADTYLKAQGK